VFFGPKYAKQAAALAKRSGCGSDRVIRDCLARAGGSFNAALALIEDHLHEESVQAELKRAGGGGGSTDDAAAAADTAKLVKDFGSFCV
jgi:hypothetical protein